MDFFSTWIDVCAEINCYYPRLYIQLAAACIIIIYAGAGNEVDLWKGKIIEDISNYS